jgi:hypothetical protein
MEILGEKLAKIARRRRSNSLPERRSPSVRLWKSQNDSGGKCRHFAG